MDTTEQTVYTEEDVKRAVSRLTDVIRMTLLKETIPSQLSVEKISNGLVFLTAKNEFSVVLTLDGKSPDLFWKIVKLTLHVNEEGISASPIAYTERIRDALQVRLFRKLSAQPLVDLYSRVRKLTKLIHNCLHG